MYHEFNQLFEILYVLYDINLIWCRLHFTSDTIWVRYKTCQIRNSSDTQHIR